VAASFPILKLLGITATLGLFKTFVWDHVFLFIVLTRCISALAGSATAATAGATPSPALRARL